MATPNVDPSFEVQLRQWVEANPERVNEKDLNNTTPLCQATSYLKSVPLVLWLVNEKGADVNAADESGDVPLHHAKSLDVLNALLDCGADPSIVISHKLTPLMLYVIWRKSEMVGRLLQDPRVRANVNAQDCTGDTALHIACDQVDEGEVPAIIHSLLQAGADANLLNAEDGTTPLSILQYFHPSHPTTLALVQQIPDAEKVSFLAKVRRLVMATTSATTLSFLQGRVVRRVSLPRVTLARLKRGQKGDNEKAKGKLRTMLAWLVGLERRSAPADVFGLVLDLLMPVWDPLRYQAPWSARGDQPPSGVNAPTAGTIA